MFQSISYGNANQIPIEIKSCIHSERSQKSNALGMLPTVSWRTKIWPTVPIPAYPTLFISLTDYRILVWQSYFYAAEQTMQNTVRLFQL